MSAPLVEWTVPRLPLGEYRAIFHYNPPLRLPAHPGFAWRGAFGAALKSTVCVVAPGECAGCMLKQSCAYSLIFETPAPSDAAKMRRYERIPHPCALRTQPAGEPEDGNYSLGVNLFGHANRQLPYVFHALRRAGERASDECASPSSCSASSNVMPKVRGKWFTMLTGVDCGHVLPSCRQFRLRRSRLRYAGKHPSAAKPKATW